MDWLEVVKTVLPAAAAWAAVKAGIATATERATTAKASADKAHERIDSILQNQ